MYNNALTKIDDFFQIDIKKNPENLFIVLKSIIDFDTGYIELENTSKYQYIFGEDGSYLYVEDLKIKNTKFGKLKITRQKEFSKKEKTILKSCIKIITNLIKDAEIAKITSMQVETLQEGIYRKNEAYELAKIQNDFFANFSHELRTPLNSIINSSELLLTNIFGTLNDKQNEYINDIYIASLHLLGMINDILDLSKLEANSMQLNYTKFSLQQNLIEVCNILKPMAVKKQIEIKINNFKDIEISADYNKLQQIFFNIINNAIKYTPKNGRITINLSQKDSKVYIKIKDNGIGIDKKYHKKIFQKFVQIGNNKNSNGLGLTITKELVEMHKGTIELKSEPQKGSEFTIHLPV